MDRATVYTGEVPLDTDFLSLERFAMIAIGKLAEMAFGQSALCDGLSCGPTTPASLSVVVGPGVMTQFTSVDTTAHAALPADTTDSIVKVGINLASTTFALAAPTTSGQSIDYIVEAAFQESDVGSVVLPYFNAAAPSVSWSGPNNDGAAQTNQRIQRVSLQVKGGASAATGTQAPPAADAGYTALYVVTVAYGQTTIVAGNISVASGAPFVGAKIPALAPLASPALTGTPTAPTPAAGDSSTKLATTAFLTGMTSGRMLNVQVFNAPGSFTYTPTAGTSSVIVDVVGGGAPGAGTAATVASQGAASSGGGAGAHARARLTSGFAGAAIVVGAAGVPASAGTGTAGGQSSFGAITAPGGAVGQVGIATGVSMITSPGPQSAAPSGGNIHQGRGDVGERGIVLDPTGSCYPSGGFGGQSPLDATLDGPGAGGSGVQAIASVAAQAGMAAQNGTVIVMEFA